MAATEGLRLGAPTLLAGSPPRRFLVLSEPALLASRRSLLILACRCRAGNFRAGRMAVWAVSEAKGPWWTPYLLLRLLGLSGCRSTESHHLPVELAFCVCEICLLPLHQNDQDCSRLDTRALPAKDYNVQDCFIRVGACWNQCCYLINQRCGAQRQLMCHVFILHILVSQDRPGECCICLSHTVQTFRVSVSCAASWRNLRLLWLKRWEFVAGVRPFCGGKKWRNSGLQSFVCHTVQHSEFLFHIWCFMEKLEITISWEYWTTSTQNERETVA